MSSFLEGSGMMENTAGIESTAKIISIKPNITTTIAKVFN
jgi:hypothetical protein